MRFSVLIPVYNVEKYLNQCITSVLIQDYSDFEVILVNDGSTDRSSKICRYFAELDSRIKYYEKKNEGLLLTRRFSIRHASGEYLVFLDSDDYWEQGILSKLNQTIESSKADMICYRFRVVSDDGEPISEDTGVFPDKTVFDKNTKEIFIREFVGSARLNNIWLKCVKSTIVDKDTDYSSFEDKKGEDILQSIALIRNAEKIYYMDDVFVNYRLSTSGRGRNFKIKYIYDYDAVKNHIYKNLIEMGVSDSIMNVFYKRYIEGLISFLGVVAIAVENYRSFIEECKHIERFPLYQKTNEIIYPSDINSSCRNDYINMKKHKYIYIYCFHRCKKTINKILSH